jgi:hypothetical protein
LSAEKRRAVSASTGCREMFGSSPLERTTEASAAMQMAESRSMGGKVLFSESQIVITSFTSIIGLLERAACKQ